MPGGSEILLLLLVVGLLFVLPRLQRRLELRVDEEKLGMRAFRSLSERHSVRRLEGGEVSAILDRFRATRRLRVPRYTAHVTDEPGVNALALPGGIVVLTAGLLAWRSAGSMSRDELAGVLAHELAHIELGHSRQLHVKDTMAGWATRLGPTPGGPLGRLALNAGLAALRKRASRDNEREADLWAQGLLRQAGYDESALEGFLRRLAGRSHQGGLWSTHPAPAERIAALQAARAR